MAFGLLVLSSGAGVISSAQAQVTPDTEEQRQRAREQAREREERQQAPDVRLPSAAEALPGTDLPAETPCYPIKEIQLDVPAELPAAYRERGASALPLDPFHFLKEMLDAYAGRCIGREGLGLILRRATAALIRAGYSTTRVGLPEQNLAGGTLRVTLVPGIIRRIRFAGSEPDRTWQSAFPSRPGDLLNLRDLEQGLDQLKRVPSQDADMEIVPGELPGESDVVITVKRAKPWRVTLSLDDSGASATGKRQLSANLSLDNPLGVNDLFYVGANQDADGHTDQRGTHGASLYYSLPWGDWTFAWQSSDYAYHQTIAGINQTFVSSGRSATHELKIQRLLERDQSGKTTLQFRTYRRISSSYLDDVEILVQRHQVAAAELGLLHRHYFGAAQLDLSIARRFGVPWYGSQQDAPDHDSASPTYQYRIDTVDLALLVPFQIAGHTLRYSGVLHGQHSLDPLYLVEDLAIGNRYTVRGYDGEQTLAAESGYYWRNDIELPLGQSGQTAYFGLDWGRVYGPYAVNLAGEHLAGAAIGLRGGGFGATYDLFVATALQTSSLPTQRPVTGFSLTYQF